MGRGGGGGGGGGGWKEGGRRGVQAVQESGGVPRNKGKGGTIRSQRRRMRVLKGGFHTLDEKGDGGPWRGSKLGCIAWV